MMKRGPMLIPLPRAQPYRFTIGRIRWGSYLRWPVMVTVFFVVDLLGRIQQVAILGVLVLIAAGTVVWSQLAGRAGSGRRRVDSERGGDQLSDRVLVCRGHPYDLVNLRDLPDAPFEPVVVSRVFPLGGELASWSFVVLFLMAMLYSKLAMMPFWLVLSGAGAVWWLVALRQQIRPLYYRVAPGQLHILRFNFLRTKGTTIRRVPLGQARVVCEYDKHRLTIMPSDDTSNRLVVDLLSLTDPQGFVRAVFQAAISTAPCPPLPEDQLLT